MRLYKFRDLRQWERLLDIVVNERLFCSEYTDLNDPFEGQLRQVTDDGSSYPVSYGTPYGVPPVKDRDISTFKRKIGGTRVCSLSTSMSDVRMWALYADSFSGVAVEIELPESTNDLYYVDYVDTLPSFYLDDTQKLDTRTVLTKKTRQWEYEAEARIISNRVFFDIKAKVTHIYLGTRVSEDQELLLQRLNLGVPISRVVLDHNNTTVRKAAQ